jgi:hypothetical protein
MTQSPTIAPIDAVHQKADATFYLREVMDDVKSIELGRTVYKMVPYVRIQQSLDGQTDGLNVQDTPVTDHHKHAYADAWVEFCKSAMDAPKHFTPLDARLFIDEPSVVVTLKGLGINSVEALAEWSTGAHDKLMLKEPALAREVARWQIRAREFLEKAESTATFSTLQRDLGKKGDELADLREEIQRMKNLLADITKKQSPAGQRALYSQAKPVDIPKYADMSRIDPQMHLINSRVNNRG